MPSLTRWEFHGNCWKRRKKKLHSSSSNSKTFSTRPLLGKHNRLIIKERDETITIIASSLGNGGPDGEMDEIVGVVAGAAVSHQVLVDL